MQGKIAGLISGVPREFIVKMDETGFVDSVDIREKKVIVSVTYQQATIPIPIDHNVKTSTMVADRTALKSMDHLSTPDR
jgi:hypothetical protein